jgi:flavin reductase (DIM6/NTAB) family NADH-FMN oxidoreductase RutF
VDVEAAFNELVGNLEYPMFVVTARAGDERLGCMVGFATQASIDPPRFLVGLSHRNRTYRHARDAAHLAVHCLPANHPELAELFGGETGDEVDKFARCAWHDGPEGLPILDDCRNWFVGHVRERLDAGDHDLYVLAPVAAQTGEQADFTFHRAKRIEPGHRP